MCVRRSPASDHSTSDRFPDIVWFEATLSNPKLWNTTIPSIPRRWKLSETVETESTVRFYFEDEGMVVFTSRTELASSMHEIEIESDKIHSDPNKLSVLFREMIQMCLWCAFTDRVHLTST